MEHLKEQTNLVEILLSEFYCCAYTSFDMDYQHFIIENLQCIKLVSTYKILRGQPSPLFFISSQTHNTCDNSDNYSDIEYFII